MDYKGIIIEESLINSDILKMVKILSTKIEEATPRHQTPWVSCWTMHTISISEKKGDAVARKLSEAIDEKHDHSWYADFRNDKFHYIIFPRKIFKVDLSDPIHYKDASEYGISIGIPEYQLDFSPEVSL